MRFVALVLLTAVVSAYLVVVPGSTDRRLLRPGAFRRTARSWRSGWVWLLGALLSWPHLLEGMLGLRRNPARTHDFDEVWRLGPAAVRRYRAIGRRTGEPVLLIHSVVTRPTILDLAPGRSLVGALLEAGHDVYLLDWGRPGPAQATAGFESYVATTQMVRTFVLQFSAAKAMHLVGYCAGAMIGMAAVRDAPEGVRSVVAIAAPGATTERWGMQGVLGANPLRPAWALNGDGLVPSTVIRESFHVLRPKALRATVGTWRRSRRDPAYRPVAAARARWVWEQTPLPGALVFDLVDLARRDALIERLTPLPVPLLVAVAERDHIVPPGSSRSLQTVATDPHAAEVVSFSAGHVAMLCGGDAASNLYPAVVGWLERKREPRTTVSA